MSEPQFVSLEDLAKEYRYLLAESNRYSIESLPEKLELRLNELGEILYPDYPKEH